MKHAGCATTIPNSSWKIKNNIAAAMNVKRWKVIEHAKCSLVDRATFRKTSYHEFGDKATLLKNLLQ